MKQLLINNLKNIPGKSYKSKVVIIECDDWGGIRMPSKSVYNKLISENIPFNKGHFDKYDTIEGKADLELLFDVLLSVQDKHGSNAIITPVVNVANPCFEKIKESQYEKYFYENYEQTLNRYGRESNLLSIWQKGIELKIFIPEYHGREHLTVPLWMNELRKGNKQVRAAFEHGYTTVIVDHLHPLAKGFRSEFFFDNNNQKQFLANSIKDGALIFEKLFGYFPNAIVPSNGIFHPDFEMHVLNAGIKYINVNHSVPIPDGKGSVTFQKYYYTDYKPKGLTKYLRNCAFEPSGSDYKDIKLTINQISAAFRWSKPAIISTHRVNFVGGIAPDNREKGLRELKLLLKTIVSLWPDVEFMSLKDFIKRNLE